MIELEVGKKYKTSSGLIGEVLGEKDYPDYPFTVEYDDGCIKQLTKEGNVYNFSEDYSYDLKKEYIEEPKPTPEQKVEIKVGDTWLDEDGDEVLILCDNAKGDYPIVGQYITGYSAHHVYNYNKVGKDLSGAYHLVSKKTLWYENIPETGYFCYTELGTIVVIVKSEVNFGIRTYIDFNKKRWDNATPLDEQYVLERIYKGKL